MYSRSKAFSISTLMAACVAAGAPAAAQTANLSSLHDALHLSAAEEPAWRTYVAAVAPDPNADGRRRAAAMMAPTLTTPRRVDLINAEMDEDMKTVRRQGEAVKAFYATLTPDQQRTFDRQTGQAAAGSQSPPASSRQPPLRQPPAGTLTQPTTPGQP